VVSVYLFDEASPGSLSWPVGSTNIIAKGNVSAIFTVQPTTAGRLVADDKISIPATITFQRANGAAPLHNLTGELFAIVN
jgi:hypothetical protein